MKWKKVQKSYFTNWLSSESRLNKPSFWVKFPVSTHWSWIDDELFFAKWLTDKRRLRLIFSRDHCQTFSPSQISETRRAGFEPAQNLSSDFVEGSCAVAITATSRRHTQSIKVWRTLSVYQSKHQNVWINKANLKYIKINPDFSAAKFFLLRSYIFHSSCSTDCTVTQHKICGNMGFHWPVPDPIRENMGQWKPVFKHILCRVKVNTIQKSTFTLKKHCY